MLLRFLCKTAPPKRHVHYQLLRRCMDRVTMACVLQTNRWDLDARTHITTSGADEPEAEWLLDCLHAMW